MMDREAELPDGSGESRPSYATMRAAGAACDNGPMRTRWVALARSLGPLTAYSALVVGEFFQAGVGDTVHRVAGMTKHRSSERDLDKAALRGEPSYVWREGQSRRLAVIREAAGARLQGRILDDGCGIGLYLEQLAAEARMAVGVESDPARARETGKRGLAVVCADCEALPFVSGAFGVVLSHEVLEHVRDDRTAAQEAVRVLASPGGRLIVFAPNRGYPFETHGIYWRGRYHFGNIPFVNYLPTPWRGRVAPHVRAYSARSLGRLFEGLPLRPVHRTIVFGAYDNIIARWPAFGRALRAVLHRLEKTPLRLLGLSHLWVLEKVVPR